MSSCPIPKNELNHWITRVGDGDNFWKSDRYSVWGISDTVHSVVQKSVQPSDIIWFVKNKVNGGNIVAFATFDKEITRGDDTCLGQLTNQDFNWVETGWVSNYLLKYKSRVNIEIEEKITLDLKGNVAIRKSIAKKTAIMLSRLDINLDEIFKKYS